MLLKKIIILIFISFAFNFLNAQEAEQKSVAVTVYNNGFGVIKDVRSFDINSGISQIALTDVAQFIDPTSVRIKLNGSVMEQNYQYDLVNFYKVLGKYIDKDIQLIGAKSELIEGKLLSVAGSQIVLKKKDGGLLMIPSTSQYLFNVSSLPEGLITKPTLIWKVNSPKAGKQDVEVAYQTTGLNWHAEYVAVLDQADKTIDLNSWVSIENNSGATYKDAKLKLVAGNVNMAPTMKKEARYGVDYSLVEVQSANAVPKPFAEKSFFEYHVYDLQRPTTLAQNETKQISLFEASDVKIDKKYIYESTINSGQNPKKVNVLIEFENRKNNNLGMPMPKGKIRLYKADKESIEFIGEDNINHTPKDEKVKLNIGAAFDVTAEEVQTASKQITYNVKEQSYKITLKNHKSENVTVEVQRQFDNNWEITESSMEYKIQDARTITYQVPVKKDGETTLTFTVRYTTFGSVK